MSIKPINTLASLMWTPPCQHPKFVCEDLMRAYVRARY